MNTLRAGTRKCFKKVRAVLRLIRPETGEKTYRAENTCFRDAARPLTDWEPVISPLADAQSAWHIREC